MAKRLTILLAALVLILASLSAAPLSHAAPAREEHLFGWLLKKDKVLVLRTDNGDYLVTGPDLSKLEGKMVEITGVVTPGDPRDTVLVQSARELDE
jgi:hypothetical protein